MGCLRLFLGIDLHLCVSVGELTCGDNFGIAAACPGSWEKEGHLWELWAHLRLRWSGLLKSNVAIGQEERSTVSPRPWAFLGWWQVVGYHETWILERKKRILLLSVQAWILSGRKIGQVPCCKFSIRPTFHTLIWVLNIILEHTKYSQYHCVAEARRVNSALLALGVVGLLHLLGQRVLTTDLVGRSPWGH